VQSSARFYAVGTSAANDSLCANSEPPLHGVARAQVEGAVVAEVLQEVSSPNGS